MFGVGTISLVKQAIGILRKYGADAHVYLPGIGTVSGLTAGNYLDSAGTTAATVDNPVGLSLDALQAMTLGDELLSGNWQNGYTTSFDTFTSTSPTSFSGTNASTESVRIKAPASFVAGITYQVTLGGSLTNATIDSSWVSNSGYGGVQNIGLTSIGQQVIFKAASTADSLMIIFAASSGAVVNAQVSVREIPGIHATQATTANKPILRRGLLNQLLQSTSFTSPWATIGTSIVPSATTYNNGDAAVLFQETAGGTFHELGQPSLSFTAGSPVTLAFIAKQSTSTAFQAFLPAAVKAGAYANFNLNAGSLGAVGAGATSSIADLGGGWYLTVLNVTPASTVSHYAYICLTNGDVNSAMDPSYSGALGNGVYLYRAGLFQGTYTAQQIIDAGGIPLTTTAAASNPSAGKYSWQFDGSNDSLSLGAPLFQMSDDHCVIAGANCTSVAFDATIADVAGQGTGQRTAAISYTATNGFIKATWSDNTLVPIVISDNVNRVGAATVSTAVKIGNAKRLRVNGVQSGATNNTVMGATTLTDGTIGMNTWSNNFFVGSIYPLIAIKGTVSDAELMVLEKYVGMCCGVSI